MKTKFQLFIPLMLWFFCSSCIKDECLREITYQKEHLTFKTYDQMKSEVGFSAAQEVQSAGQVYIHQNLLCIVEHKKGVHFFDNSNPANPIPLSFLNVEGCHGIEGHNNFLFLDGYLFLVLLDISDINNMEISFEENVFSSYLSQYAIDGKVLTKVETEQITEVIDCDVANSNAGSDVPPSSFFQLLEFGINQKRFAIFDGHIVTSAGNNHNIYGIGTNGSLIYKSYVSNSFQDLVRIEGNYLFTNTFWNTQIYNISDPTLPNLLNSVQELVRCDDFTVWENKIYTSPMVFNSGTFNTCFVDDNSFKEFSIDGAGTINFQVLESVTNPKSLKAIDDVLYLSQGSDGIKVFDIEGGTLENAPLINSIDVANVNGRIRIAEEGQRILYFKTTSFLYQFNIDNPQAPQLISALNFKL